MAEFNGLQYSAPDLRPIAFYPADTSKTLVIHLQDPHAAVGAQESIARGLGAWIGSLGVRRVFVEGGWGDCGLSAARTAKGDGYWKSRARAMLLDGRLAGEEYLNLTGPADFSITGIEDPALYLRSVRVFARIRASRERVIAFLNRAEAHADAILVRGLDETSRGFFTALDRDLEPLARWRQVKGQMSRAGVRLDRRSLLRRIDAVWEREAASTDPSSGAGLNPDWLSARMPRLIRELEDVEKHTVRGLLKDADAATAWEIRTHVRLLKSASYLGLTPADAEALRAAVRVMPSVSWQAWINRRLRESGSNERLLAEDRFEPFLADVLWFYRLTGRRDRAFVQNISSSLKGPDASGTSRTAPVVLIAGGHHTGPLVRRLNAVGHPVAVFAPVIEFEGDSAQYEERLLASSDLRKIAAALTPEFAGIRPAVASGIQAVPEIAAARMAETGGYELQGEHQQNEDAHFHKVLSSGIVIAGVFDGIGQSEDGAMASRVVMESIQAELEHGLEKIWRSIFWRLGLRSVPEWSARRLVRKAFQNAHARLREAHEALHQLSTAGTSEAIEDDASATTASVVVAMPERPIRFFKTPEAVRDWRVITGNIGDSRAYQSGKEGSLRPLTLDNVDANAPDSVVEQRRIVQGFLSSVRDAADLTDVWKEIFIARNQTVGVHPRHRKPDPRIQSFRVPGSDRLVLLTDGISDVATNEEIAEWMMDAWGDLPASAARRVLEAARSRQEDTGNIRAKRRRDDMTAVVIQLDPDPGASPSGSWSLKPRIPSGTGSAPWWQAPGDAFIAGQGLDLREVLSDPVWRVETMGTSQPDPAASDAADVTWFAGYDPIFDDGFVFNGQWPLPDPDWRRRAVRIGDVYFVDSFLKEPIEAAREAAGADAPRVIYLADFQSSLTNQYKNFTPYAVSAVRETLRMDVRDKVVWEAGSADGILSLVALLNGAQKVILTEKEDGEFDWFRSHLTANGMDPDQLEREGRLRFIRADLNDVDARVAEMGVESPDILLSNIGPHYGRAEESVLAIADRLGTLRTLLLAGHEHAWPADRSGRMPDTSNFFQKILSEDTLSANFNASALQLREGRGWRAVSASTTVWEGLKVGERHYPRTDLMAVRFDRRPPSVAGARMADQADLDRDAQGRVILPPNLELRAPRDPAMLMALYLIFSLHPASLTAIKAAKPIRYVIAYEDDPGFEGTMLGPWIQSALRQSDLLGNQSGITVVEPNFMNTYIVLPARYRKHPAQVAYALAVHLIEDTQPIFTANLINAFLEKSLEIFSRIQDRGNVKHPLVGRMIRGFKRLSDGVFYMGARMALSDSYGEGYWYGEAQARGRSAQDRAAGIADAEHWLESVHSQRLKAFYEGMIAGYGTVMREMDGRSGQNAAGARMAARKGVEANDSYLERPAEYYLSEDLPHHEVLGVRSGGVGLDVLREHWKRLIQKWHPDHHPQDEKRTNKISQRINEAYQTLRDRLRRGSRADESEPATSSRKSRAAGKRRQDSGSWTEADRAEYSWNTRSFDYTAEEQALFAGLRDPRKSVSTASIIELEQIARKHPDKIIQGAVSMLREPVSFSNVLGPTFAAWLLVEIGTHEALRPLFMFLHEPWSWSDPMVRAQRESIELAFAQRMKNPEGVAALRSELNRIPMTGKEYAASGLASIGTDDAIEALRAKFDQDLSDRSDDGEYRVYIVHALKAFDNPAAWPKVRGWLEQIRDHDPEKNRVAFNAGIALEMLDEKFGRLAKLLPESRTSGARMAQAMVGWGEKRIVDADWKTALYSPADLKRLLPVYLKLDHDRLVYSATPPSGVNPWKFIVSIERAGKSAQKSLRTSAAAFARRDAAARKTMKDAGLNPFNEKNVYRLQRYMPAMELADVLSRIDNFDTYGGSIRGVREVLGGKGAYAHGTMGFGFDYTDRRSIQIKFYWALLNIMLEDGRVEGDAAPILDQKGARAEGYKMDGEGHLTGMGVTFHDSFHYGPIQVVFRKGDNKAYNRILNQKTTHDDHAIYLVPTPDVKQWILGAMEEARKNKLVSAQHVRRTTAKLLTYDELVRVRARVDAILAGTISPADAIDRVLASGGGARMAEGPGQRYAEFRTGETESLLGTDRMVFLPDMYPRLDEDPVRGEDFAQSVEAVASAIVQAALSGRLGSVDGLNADGSLKIREVGAGAGIAVLAWLTQAERSGRPVRLDVDDIDPRFIVNLRKNLEIWSWQGPDPTGRAVADEREPGLVEFANGSSVRIRKAQPGMDPFGGEKQEYDLIYFNAPVVLPEAVSEDEEWEQATSIKPRQLAGILGSVLGGMARDGMMLMESSDDTFDGGAEELRQENWDPDRRFTIQRLPSAGGLDDVRTLFIIRHAAGSDGARMAESDPSEDTMLSIRNYRQIEAASTIYESEGSIDRDLDDLKRIYGKSVEESMERLAVRGGGKVLFVGAGRGYAIIDLNMRYPDVQIHIVNREAGLLADHEHVRDRVIQNMTHVPMHMRASHETEIQAASVREFDKLHSNVQIDDLSYPDSSKGILGGYDLIILGNETLQYISDPLSVVGRLYKNLKDGGELMTAGYRVDAEIPDRPDQTRRLDVTELIASLGPDASSYARSDASDGPGNIIFTKVEGVDLKFPFKHLEHVSIRGGSFLGTVYDRYEDLRAVEEGGFLPPVLDPGSGANYNKSHLNRDIKEWAAARALLVPVIRSRIASGVTSPDKRSLTVYVMGASTGEEIARAYYELDRTLRSEHEDPADWKLRVIGIEKNPEVHQKAVRRLAGEEPFVWSGSETPGSETYAYQVVAALNRDILKSRSSMSVVQADITDPAALDKALAGSSAPDLVTVNRVLYQVSQEQRDGFLKYADMKYPDAVLMVSHADASSVLEGHVHLEDGNHLFYVPKGRSIASGVARVAEQTGLARVADAARKDPAVGRMADGARLAVEADGAAAFVTVRRQDGMAQIRVESRPFVLTVDLKDVATVTDQAQLSAAPREQAHLSQVVSRANRILRSDVRQAAAVVERTDLDYWLADAQGEVLADRVGLILAQLDRIRKRGWLVEYSASAELRSRLLGIIPVVPAVREILSLIAEEPGSGRAHDAPVVAVLGPDQVLLKDAAHREILARDVHGKPMAYLLLGARAAGVEWTLADLEAASLSARVLGMQSVDQAPGRETTEFFSSLFGRPADSASLLDFRQGKAGKRFMVLKGLFLRLHRWSDRVLHETILAQQMSGRSA